MGVINQWRSGPVVSFRADKREVSWKKQKSWEVPEVQGDHGIFSHFLGMKNSRMHIIFLGEDTMMPIV